MGIAEVLLVACVLAGALPMFVGALQALSSTLHLFAHRSMPTVPDNLPRVAVVVPAWNEGAVIGRTIEMLVGLAYPAEALRVYVVDDASTDETPAVVRAAAQRRPGRVRHVRREQGGEGKAHTINAGLRRIQEDGWYEAVLVTDADVLFTPYSLVRMVRHLTDPQVGAVMGYIKEGSSPPNYLNRFIGYEYANAQGCARRAQNLAGVQACLAGGAQLLSRAALEAAGGEVDTTTLAEDTVTTFNVQLAGYRVVFDPHATVWAEEPPDVRGLWKQRLRWARGNIQVTLKFRRCWLRGRRNNPLGGVWIALIWFCVLLMPVLMVLSSAALLALFFIDRGHSVDAFRALWVTNLITYLLVTLTTFSIDPQTARRAWAQGFAFPGLISLAIILYTVDPDAISHTLPNWVLLTAYLWTSLSMVGAWIVLRLDSTRRLHWMARPLLYVVGYGPLLCAVTAAAFAKEARGADMVWEKTQKTGAVGDVA
jgi:cellulose synthase/poly-beta-1,6-N-acetylglucosamine synthase-like glycosyltransferase